MDVRYVFLRDKCSARESRQAKAVLNRLESDQVWNPTSAEPVLSIGYDREITREP